MFYVNLVSGNSVRFDDISWGIRFMTDPKNDPTGYVRRLFGIPTPDGALFCASMLELFQNLHILDTAGNRNALKS